MTTPTEPTDDFEAAKSVFEKLKDLSKERQERVLRWVAEGLGVSNPASGVGQHTLAPTLAHQQTPPPLTPQGATDIKSFVASKKPRSDQQFATVVAYYYRFEAPPAKRLESINTEVVQEAARLAARDRLTNPTSTLNNARNQGYLDRADRGEFAINTVGENLVAMTLPGDGTGSPAKKKRKGQAKRRSAKKVAKPSKRG